MKKITFVCFAAAVSLGLSFLPVQAAAPKQPASVTIIVKASPASTFQTEMNIQSAELMKRFRANRTRPAQNPPQTDAYISLGGTNGDALFPIESSGEWYDANRKEMVEPPDEAKKKLARYIEAARQAHYGKLAPWEEAKRTVSMKSVIEIVDVETGQRFRAQRRAGRSHADMQPLTKADTAAMKQIYNGEWSWRRRAVLVRKDGSSFAASMHGMPHGGDGIPDNGFSGHFCVHFLNSSTHGSKSVDADHQWMVYKAAGRLDEAFGKASPYTVVDSFFIALNQQDPELLRRSFAAADHPALIYYLNAMDDIKAIRKTKHFTEEDVSRLQSLELQAEAAMHRSGSRPELQVFTFKLKKASADAPWKIDSLTWSASGKASPKSGITYYGKRNTIISLWGKPRNWQ